MKKTLSVILSAIMLLCLCTPAYALATGGEIEGTSLIWSLGNDGTLTVSGIGAMPSYESATAPWYDYKGLIQSVIIGDGVKNVSAYAFSHCNILTSVTLSDSVTAIGENAFKNCGELVTVKGGKGLYRIFEYAFYGCYKLENIEFYFGLYDIGDYAFSACRALKEAHLPDSVKRLGVGSFSYCSGLERVTLPADLYSITDSLFMECTALRYLSIPENVLTINVHSLSNCESLEWIYVPAGVTEFDYNAINNCNSLKTVYGYTGVTFEVYDKITEKFSEYTFVAVDTLPMGDLDGNGSVDASDYVYLKRAVLGTYELPIPFLRLADANEDLTVNAADYTLLKRAILNTFTLPTLATFDSAELGSFVAGVFSIAREASCYEDYTFDAPIFTTPFDELPADYIARTVYYADETLYSDAIASEGEDIDTVLTFKAPVSAVSEKAYELFGYEYDFTSVAAYSDGVTGIGSWYDADSDSIVLRVKKYLYSDFIGGSYESYGHDYHKVISANKISLPLYYNHGNFFLCEIMKMCYIGEVIIEKQSDGTYRVLSYTSYEKPIDE